MREVFYASLICLLLVGVWHFMKEEEYSPALWRGIITSGNSLEEGVNRGYFITQIDLD